jgi:ribokinase
MLSAAHVARAAGAAVVADFEGRPTEPDFPELMAQVDHLIVSADFASWWTGRNDPADAARGLWSPERAVVIVTCGAAGCWWLSREGAGQPRHQPAFQVEVVNTTGCGDVFHGAYAAGLAQGLSLPDRLRLASATAALKAGCSGGQAGIPSRSVVQAFLLHYDDQNR